jgi:hypothetical protein
MTQNHIGTPVISVSDPDPHSISSWIRIHIRNADPDSGGLISAEIEGKTGAKRQKVQHKMLT